VGEIGEEGFAKASIPRGHRILDATAELGREPHPQGSKKLTGSENSYRIRIGDYRVIYDILDSLVIIEVQAVGHRKDIYRK
jgi:mRNA interferase RelE/StbE